MFNAFKKNMWTCGFFVSKVFFLVKCSPNRFNFFVKFNIFHKKGSMCSKHSKNKNTYTFWYSNILKHYCTFEFVIMVQSKIIDLILMKDLIPKNLSLYYVICHIWPQTWYSIWKSMWKMQYKPIKKFHIENVVLGKDFNFGTTSSFFHLFILKEK
jgi:hypothetical protein